MKDRINQQDLEELLSKSAASPPADLPEGFTSEVISRARRVRMAIRNHWRILAVSSVLALATAVFFGFKTAQPRETEKRPALLLFQSEDKTAPFAIR